MANLALVTADTLRVVRTYVQKDFYPAEAIAIGQVARMETTTGNATKANGSSAAEVRAFGLCIESEAAAVTLLAHGIVDGFDLSALNWDDPVYISDTDGSLSTAVGDSTVDVIVGRVVPGYSELLGQANAKLLYVNFIENFI